MSDHPSHMVREDVDGYYCGVCGKYLDEASDGCTRPIYLDSYDLDVLSNTVEDALKHEVTRNNPDLVKKALAALRTWRSQHAQRTRLGHPG